MKSSSITFILPLWMYSDFKKVRIFQSNNDMVLNELHNDMVLNEHNYHGLVSKAT